MKSAPGLSGTSQTESIRLPFRDPIKATLAKFGIQSEDFSAAGVGSLGIFTLLAIDGEREFAHRELVGSLLLPRPGINSNMVRPPRTSFG
jgi:hypothetical protein